MRFIQDTLQGMKVADQKGRVTLGSRYAGKHFAVRETADGATILTPILLVPEKDSPLTSDRLAQSFADMEALEENWDGHGSPTPTPALVAYAREILALLHAGALARGLHWEEPHIGSNERGQISLEWWREARTLTVFIRSEDKVDYLKSWGTDIVSEMEDGEVSRIAEFAALSRWLYPEEIQAA